MVMKNIVPKLKMKRKDFWKYISISHENAKNNNEFVDYLINILSKKTDEETPGLGLLRPVGSAGVRRMRPVRRAFSTRNWARRLPVS